MLWAMLMLEMSRFEEREAVRDPTSLVRQGAGPPIECKTGGYGVSAKASSSKTLGSLAFILCGKLSSSKLLKSIVSTFRCQGGLSRNMMDQILGS